MCEHGLQLKELFSKIKLLQLYGVKPNSLTDDPKIVISFVFTAVRQRASILNHCKLKLNTFSYLIMSEASHHHWKD